MSEPPRTYTIYRDLDKPLESRYSVRETAGGEPIAEGVSLEQAREEVRDRTRACVFRGPGDDEAIVETWI